jgi:hypothetical protein
MTTYPSDLDSMIVRDKRVMKKIKGAITRKAINY